MSTSPGFEGRTEKQPLNKNEEEKNISIDNAEIEDQQNNNRQSNCCCTCPILHPYGAFKIVWDLIVSVVIVISALEIPLTMAFDIPVTFETGIGIMSFCIDIFLLCDICVTFRTAYFDHWDPLRLIINPRVIAIHYAKGWFVFDLITSFPFTFLAPFGEAEEDGLTGVKILRLVRLLRLLRVFRIYKMLGIVREFNQLFPSFKKWLGISQVMVLMLFVAHYFACMYYIYFLSLKINHFCNLLWTQNEKGIWFAVGKSTQRKGLDSWLDHSGIDVEDGFDVSVAYSTCMYWSIVTLFTVCIMYYMQYSLTETL